MSYGEAAPLPNALVDHHLAEEARRASWGQFGGRGVPLPPHHAGDFGRLQLQVHVLLERPDAGVHLNAQLVGRHRCAAGLTRAVTRAVTRALLLKFFSLFRIKFSHIGWSRAADSALPSPVSRQSSRHVCTEVTANDSVDARAGQLKHTFPVFCIASALSILPLAPLSLFFTGFGD